jgi:hypothetical protein
LKGGECDHRVGAQALEGVERMGARADNILPDAEPTGDTAHTVGGFRQKRLIG